MTEVETLRGEPLFQCTGLDWHLEMTKKLSAAEAQLAELKAELEIAWSDCHDGKCDACPKCCDSLRAQLVEAQRERDEALGFLAVAKAGLLEWKAQHVELHTDRAAIIRDRDYFKAAYTRKLADEAKALEAAQSVCAERDAITTRVETFAEAFAAETRAWGADLDSIDNMRAWFCDRMAQAGFLAPDWRKAPSPKKPSPAIPASPSDLVVCEGRLEPHERAYYCVEPKSAPTTPASPGAQEPSIPLKNEETIAVAKSRKPKNTQNLVAQRTDVEPHLRTEAEREELFPRLEVLANELCLTQAYIFRALLRARLTIVPLDPSARETVPTTPASPGRRVGLRLLALMACSTAAASRPHPPRRRTGTVGSRNRRTNRPSPTPLAFGQPPAPEQPATQVVNQCDGCRRGLPIRPTESGSKLHYNPDGSYDHIACTADRYVDATQVPGKEGT